MRFLPCCAITALLAAPGAASDAGAPSNLQFDNGLWYAEGGFAPRTFYSVDGRLSADRPERVDRVVDLGGGHVVPPLCEAHNHNLGGDEDEAAVIRRYLEAGIYYVATLSNFPLYAGVARRNFNRPDSVDVQFANGGITAPAAHPIPLRERLLGYGAYPGFTVESLADHAYFVVGTAADLDRIWPIALSYRPDFIKIFVMNSEDHDAPPEQTDYTGDRGLHPAFVRAIVPRAHAHGLRVFAHVDTAADFALAVDAGVDVIAHLPGRRAPERIAPETARRAAEAGIAVITTAALATRLREDDPDGYAAVRDAQIANLRLLHDAGVPLAVGSDLYDADSRVEAAYLRDMNVFSNAQLLDMWTENCAATVFPDRAIGALKEGYDTSFIVLDGNPLEDWSALAQIRLRFKDGRPLDLPAAENAAE